MASFDGPRITGGAGRQFGLTTPVIRLWSGATLERVCAFDAARNTPRIEDGPLWERVDEAATIQGSTGRRWPQVMGTRFRLRLGFLIHSPGHGPASSSRPPHDGFTELDLQALVSAHHRSRDIEFLPHGPGGSGQNANYLVELVDYGCSRPAHLGTSAHWIEVIGLNVVTGLAPAEL